jgi:hypothetical protein
MGNSLLLGSSSVDIPGQLIAYGSGVTIEGDFTFHDGYN